MKLGINSLCLFGKNLDDILEFVSNKGFKSLELLSEGPYHPEVLLKNEKLLEKFQSYSLDYYIHSPNVDLNIASINKGIRRESVRQIKETLNLADKICAKAVTVHPGHIGRIEKRVRDMAVEFATESLNILVEYSKDLETCVSVENMPNKRKFLGTSPEELRNFSLKTNCKITIDTGHANTCEETEEFFNLKNISYFHIHDNNGQKDQHLELGGGCLDLSLLENIKEGVLELNSFKKVEKSLEILEKMEIIDYIKL